MTWPHAPLSMIFITLLTASALAAALAIVAWRRRHVPGAVSLILLLLTVAVWSLSDAAAEDVTELGTRILWAKVSYLGIASIAVLWFVFVLKYLRHSLHLDRRFVGALWILPVVTLVLVATNEWHGLVWSNVRLIQVANQTRAIFEHGPWFWVSAGYNYLLIGVGAVLCARTSIHANRIERSRALALLAATATPLAANVAYLTGRLPFPGLDATPLAFAITGAISAWSIFRLGLLDLGPMARHALLEKLGDGVLVLDGQGRIAEANEVARGLLDFSGSPVGTAAKDALTAWPELAKLAAAQGDVRAQIPFASDPDSQLELRGWSLRDINGQPTGRLLILRDVTQREHTVNALKREEENFRLAFEANPFPMTITRLADSHVVNANKAALAFYEIEATDLANTTLMDFYAGPGQRARMLRALKACGQISDMLMEFRTKAGRSRWALVNAFPLEFKGQPCLLSGYADITERKHVEEALAQRARELTALYETSLVVNSQPDIQSLLRAIVDRATDLLQVPMGGLHLLQADLVTLKPEVSRNLPGDYSKHNIRMGEGLIGRAAQTGEPVVIPGDLEATTAPLSGSDAASPAKGSESAPYRRALAVPLKSGDHVIGVLSVYGKDSGVFVDDQVHLVHLFADQAALALENARLYAEVQQLAVVDELTGIYNRRGMLQFGEREFTRSARFGRPLSVLMIDLDHFKSVNDLLGHAAGDRVLRKVAECLRGRARSVDILARYGGEELVLLLPEADLVHAVQVAERLRAAIEQISTAADSGPVQVTASFGVACLSVDTPDLASLIAKADSALYRAKQAGRNRVATGSGAVPDGPGAATPHPPPGEIDIQAGW